MTQPIILMLGNCQENYLPETSSSNWEHLGLVFQLEALTDNMCLLFPFFIPDTSSLYVCACLDIHSYLLVKQIQQIYMYLTFNTSRITKDLFNAPVQFLVLPRLFQSWIVLSTGKSLSNGYISQKLIALSTGW